MGSNIIDMQGGTNTASPTAGEAASASPPNTPPEECWRVIEDPEAAHVAWDGGELNILQGSILHLSPLEVNTPKQSVRVEELLQFLQQSWKTADAIVKAACKNGLHLHVVKSLGSGGQCQVLLVQPVNNLGMPCAQRMALKVMLNAALDGRDQQDERDQQYGQELAFQEMAVGMLVESDNLVTCLGTGFVGIRLGHGQEVIPVSCVLMEVCRCSVSDYLDMCNEAGQPCSMLQRMMYAHSALKATCHLHDNRFVHRDLKLDNLLLAQNYTAKLADLGYGRLVDLDQCEPGYYDTCASGTTGYKAPERVFLASLEMLRFLMDMLTYARNRIAKVATELETARATHQQLQQELYLLQQQQQQQQHDLQQNAVLQQQQQQQQQQHFVPQHPMGLGLPAAQLETAVQQLQCRVAQASAACEAWLKEKCRREEYVLHLKAKIERHQQLVGNKVEWDNTQFCKADVWSWGCVFMELLTVGEQPFEPVLERLEERLGTRASDVRSLMLYVSYGTAEECGDVGAFLQRQYDAAHYPWVSNSRIMSLLGKVFNVFPEDRPTAAEALIEMESILKEFIAESEDNAYPDLHWGVVQAAKADGSAACSRYPPVTY